ncbi:hypothetical protein K503DRAFT_145758 [Rhizopogon vinicolor AM-OR11-026]|uniref:Uncharacterized protein n=1 Tax=Rhizopogon vinicolor AM-OR11-026 TaxID=1314800 RepID=A0A1B7N1C6_9AGAM|nr:hypothetical protein K503DRAFT_145758 [Rhizopogon vinicolor AM-OR11-026]
MPPAFQQPLTNLPASKRDPQQPPFTILPCSLPEYSLRLIRPSSSPTYYSINDTVITVPAHCFNDSQRQTIENAGILTRMNVLTAVSSTSIMLSSSLMVLTRRSMVATSSESSWILVDESSMSPS